MSLEWLEPRDNYLHSIRRANPSQGFSPLQDRVVIQYPGNPRAFSAIAFCSHGSLCCLILYVS